MYQVVYLSSGGSILHFAGAFEYHPLHDHMHFNDFALYTLQPVNAPGGSERTGAKTTFCVMDTTPVNTRLLGAPGLPFYTQCGRDLQGMSVGWGDTYGAHLAGQEIDFTSNADGIYQLKIEVDPKKVLVEIVRERQPVVRAAQHQEAKHGHRAGQQWSMFRGGVDHPELGAQWAPACRSPSPATDSPRAWASASMAATAHVRSPATCS